MSAIRRKVVIIDRPAWYLPVIEREELSHIGAEVLVGWAQSSDYPTLANLDQPQELAARRARSCITSAYVPFPASSEEATIRMARDADAILVVAARITERVLDALPRLRVIGRCGAGVDNIDLSAAARRSVKVISAPGYCAAEVADHTLMFLLACSRKLLYLHHRMQVGVWARSEATPMPALHAQSLGLIGFGRVGREVAKRAQPHGLKVLVCDSNLQDDEALQLGVTPTSFNDLLAWSDYVSVHVPLTQDTRHLLGAAQLQQMKRTAFLINTSRGGIVDQRALFAALEKGQIAGAALDVFEDEPATNLPIQGIQDRILATPHIGGLSDESQILLRRNICRAVATALSQEAELG